MAKLCTQTELLSWHVGGLNSGLLPLIFVQITTFFIGEMLYSTLLFTSRNGSKAKCCVLGSCCKFMGQPWEGSHAPKSCILSSCSYKFKSVSFLS